MSEKIEWTRRKEKNRYGRRMRLIREAVREDGVGLRYWAEGSTWYAEADIPGYGTTRVDAAYPGDEVRTKEKLIGFDVVKWREDKLEWTNRMLARCEDQIEGALSEQRTLEALTWPPESADA